MHSQRVRLKIKHVLRMLRIFGNHSSMFRQAVKQLRKLIKGSLLSNLQGNPVLATEIGSLVLDMESAISLKMKKLQGFESKHSVKSKRADLSSHDLVALMLMSNEIRAKESQWFGALQAVLTILGFHNQGNIARQSFLSIADKSLQNHVKDLTDQLLLLRQRRPVLQRVLQNWLSLMNCDVDVESRQIVRQFEEVVQSNKPLTFARICEVEDEFLGQVSNMTKQMTTSFEEKYGETYHRLCLGLKSMNPSFSTNSMDFKLALVSSNMRKVRVLAARKHSAKKKAHRKAVLT